jgi:hypothetical protein
MLTITAANIKSAGSASASTELAEVASSYHFLTPYRNGGHDPHNSIRRLPSQSGRPDERIASRLASLLHHSQRFFY